MDNKMENTQRIDYFDMSKGFAIIAIVLGHIYNDNFIVQWLYSFHVPLFFIISGILIKQTNTNKRGFKEIVFSRVKRLIVPYFAFEIMAILIWMVVNNEINLVALRWKILDTILLYTEVGATWFLPTIFVSEIFFVSLLKLIKNNKIVISLSILLFIIPFFIYSENHYGIVFFRNFTAVGFLALGYYSHSFLTQRILDIKYVIVLMIASIVSANLGNMADLYSLVYGNPFMYSICAVLGSIVIMLFFKKVKSKLLVFFGKNSLIIMATHQLILRYFINRITGISDYGYIDGGVALVSVMIIEIPIIYIINNYLPFMLGKFNKRGRNGGLYDKRRITTTSK